jgi:hypothetical protein
MAVSVLTRPITFQLDPTPIACTIGNSVGSALVTKSNHGLVDGDYIYLKSNIEDYCGFWYVDQVSTNTFKILEYSGATAVSYVADDSDADYYENDNTITRGWNAVELPIVYKLSNTLWPTNSADTVRDITSVLNSNGYCHIAGLDGDIKATGSAAKLEFVKITGCSDEHLNGVYQIISYSSDTSFIINLAYSSTVDTDLTSNASIQFYYNNYSVKVKLYGGIPSGHQYDDLRPVEEIAELRLVPDSDNLVKFSIHELLKSQLKTRNNPLLGTLPNNIDFWTSFYITYAESYDDSDGTTLSSTTTSYTDDSTNFIGYAVNAKLAFKNVYSGGMSLYIGTSKKFLTLFDEPVIFPGNDFDISFLNTFSGANVEIGLRYQYYLNGALQDTVTRSITSTDEGVYRIQIVDPPCVYDRVDLTVMATSVDDLLNGTFASGTLDNWSQSDFGPAWSAASGGAQVAMSMGDTSRRFEQNYQFHRGLQYTLNWDVIRTSTGGGEAFNVVAYLSNSDYTVTQQIAAENVFANGTTTSADAFTAEADFTKIYFIVTTAGA